MKTFKKILSNVIVFTSCVIPAFAFTTNKPALIQDSPKEVIDQVWQIIYRDYMDSNGSYQRKDWIKMRYKLLSATYDDSKQAYDAIKTMLQSLNDPYTRFLEPKEFNEMKIDTSGELVGIGIQISVNENTKDVIVISPIEGTPAFKAGIKARDIIFEIDGFKTQGMSIEKVVKLIRGKKGTKVSITILRNNEFIKLSLIRDIVKIKTVSSKLNKSDLGMIIAYIRLKQFSANASKEMKSTILALEKQNPDAYILDLRSNPGGLLEASIDISRHFLNKGIIVSTKTKDGITDIRKARGNALTSKPLAVLVNEGSASASEILSGAIQDNYRGILVGKKTFGKGLVQSVRYLSDGSGLAVTVAKYLTPSGKDINKNGIKPNIEVEFNLHGDKRLTSIDLGTERDSQYVSAKNALYRRLKTKLNLYTFSAKKTNFENAVSQELFVNP